MVSRLVFAGAVLPLTAILVLTSGCADTRSVTGLRPNTASISASTFPNLSSVEFFPSSVGGGGSVTGRVTLDGPAFDGARVLLSMLRIVRADFKGGGRGGTLRVEATSTSATATLSAYRDAATTVTFVLTNLGGGRYEGSGSFSGATPRTVTVRSNLGGSATAPVRRR